ncbi:PTS sugar transporter subunit IIC [Enterococcus casseliflavus]|uniref:PTS sugar transporter subunit IIC n=1 Tax=Enterococcus casseliflavus TaxID=37734 RepID=UPI00119F90B7|nr:PTS transporter subunit EIIC [Enterococcus casseliflavus]
MNRLIEGFQENFVPKLVRISENRFLVAVRNGVAVTMPLTIIGSLFLILANLPFPGWTEFVGEFGVKLGAASNFTFGILGLAACIGIAYYLAASYEIDRIGSVVLAVCAFLLLQAGEEWTIDPASLGASGLFTGIVTAIATVVIHRFFLKHRLVIRMPAEVPPAVAKSFSVLLPGAAIITGAWVIRVLLEFNVNQFVQAIFSPLAVGLNTLPGMLLYTFLILLLWCLGIHGSNAMGSIGDPIFLALLAANTEAYTAGEPLPNIFAGGFYIMFLCYGGTGSTLGLIINMLVSKKKAYRSLGKMALPSAIFCINEPIIFGFPIVMNPIMMIPFILTPLVLCVGTYFLSVTNVIGRIMFNPPWTTPPFINTYLATGGNIPAVLWSIASLLISVAIYYPFFKISERSLTEEEKGVTDAVAAKGEN